MDNKLKIDYTFFIDINLSLCEDNEIKSEKSYINSSEESENSDYSETNNESDNESDTEKKSADETEEELSYSETDSNSNTSDSSESYCILDCVDDEELFKDKINGNEFLCSVLKNRYLVIQKINYGAFSSVWQAYDILEKKLVAVKILNPFDYNDGIRELKNFEKIKKINNDNLLNLLDYFEVKPIHKKYYSNYYLETYKNYIDNNHIVLVLPLLGYNLDNLLSNKAFKNGLSIKQSLNIIKQLIETVKLLEDNNLFHSDLKPENILLDIPNRINFKIEEYINSLEIIINKKLNWNETYEYLHYKTLQINNFINENNIKKLSKKINYLINDEDSLNNIKVKLCDFNLTFNLEKNLNKILQIQTRYYRAPEIILGCPLHLKSDYWSIGCIFYEILTGKLLFYPDKSKYVNRDTFHIILIEQLCGNIPDKLLKTAKFYKNVYDDNGNFKNFDKEIQYISLKPLLNNNINISKNKYYDKIHNILKGLLVVNPDNRKNLNDIIYEINQIF